MVTAASLCLFSAGGILTIHVFSQKTPALSEWEGRERAEQDQDPEPEAPPRAEAPQPEVVPVRAPAPEDKAQEKQKPPRGPVAEKSPPAEQAKANDKAPVRPVEAEARPKPPEPAAPIDLVQQRMQQAEIAATFAWTSYPIAGVAYSPDGRLLATAEKDAGIKLWDGQGNQAVSRLVGHRDALLSVAFSPDSRRLVSTDWSGAVKVWDVAAGQAILSVPGERKVWGATFSPDGRRLALGGWDGALRVWDAATGQEISALVRHTSWVTTVAFSSDGTRLASASADKSVKIWESATGRELVTLTGHKGPVLGVAFSPDGKRLATCSGGLDARLTPLPGEVKVWDSGTGREVFSLPSHSSWATGVAFSPDGQCLASVSRDRTVKLTLLGAGTRPEYSLTLTNRSGSVHSVAFRPDSQRLALSTGGFDIPRRPTYATANIWNIPTVRAHSLLSPKDNRETPIWSADFSHVATLSDQGVRVWDVERKTSSSLDKNLPAGSRSQWGMVLSPNGASVGINTQATGAVVLDMLHGRVTPLGPHSTIASFSPDGKHVVGRSGEEMKVWHSATGKPNISLGPPGRDTLWAFSPDGERLARLDNRGMMGWFCETGRVLFTLKPGPEATHCMVFSPDGAKLRTVTTEIVRTPQVTSVVGRTAVRVSTTIVLVVKEWNASTFQPGPEALLPKDFPKEGLVLSPEGKLLVGVTRERGESGIRSIKVWNAPTKTVLSLTTHVMPWGGSAQARSRFQAILLSPDGKRLVHQGREVELWDLATGQEVLTIASFNSSPYVTSVGPLSLRLLSRSTFWDLANVELVTSLK
jgi:WD40 repeat protein